MILVQNIKTGGFHPKLEFSSRENIDALGVPKTGVLLSQLEFFQNWSFVTKTPKLKFSVKNENLWNHQNWRCCFKTGSFVIQKLGYSMPDQNSSFAIPKLEFSLNYENLWNPKTGGFLFWKLGCSLPDQNSSFAPPKLEFSPLSENLVKIFEYSKLEVLVQNWRCSRVQKSVLCVTQQNSSFDPKLEFWTLSQNCVEVQNWRWWLKTGSFETLKNFENQMLSVWSKLEFSFWKLRTGGFV